MLSELRARAFERGSVQLLGWVNAPGSAAEAADLEQIRALEERGERLDGLDIEVFRADAVASPVRGEGPGRCLGRTLRMGAGAQRRIEAAAAPGGPLRQEVLLELERTGQQWRIAAVLPAAASLQERADAER